MMPLICAAKTGTLSAPVEGWVEGQRMHACGRGVLQAGGGPLLAGRLQHQCCAKRGWG